MIRVLIFQVLIIISPFRMKADCYQEALVLWSRLDEVEDRCNVIFRSTLRNAKIWCSTQQNSQRNVSFSQLRIRKNMLRFIFRATATEKLFRNVNRPIGRHAWEIDL